MVYAMIDGSKARRPAGRVRTESLSSRSTTDAAGQLLDSPASADRTAYILETPEKTHMLMAVNGKLSDREQREFVEGIV